MIILSAPTFDLDGTLPLAATGSKLADRSRRVSRVATLDGGCEITDNGFADADRTIGLVHENPTADESESAAYLLETYSLLLIATSAGLFLAAPEALTDDGQTLEMRLLVKEKLTT
jgi:hypothetical protein